MHKLVEGKFVISRCMDSDCNECDQPAACKNSETLHKMRSGTLDAGLFVKTENVDRKQLLEKWIGELKGKWPHCILFLPE